MLVHDDVIKWKHFPRYWPFVRGIHRFPVISPHKRPVTRSVDVFFDLRLNKRLRKQSRGWWFETLLRPLWRHCNVWLTSHGRKKSVWVIYNIWCHFDFTSGVINPFEKQIRRNGRDSDDDILEYIFLNENYYIWIQMLFLISTSSKFIYKIFNPTDVCSFVDQQY